MIEQTLSERGSRYGNAVDNARVTQSMMDVILKAPSSGNLTPMHKETLHMICHKIARICCGDVWYSDNAHDIAGYAKLLEDFQVSVSEQINENN